MQPQSAARLTHLASFSTDKSFAKEARPVRRQFRGADPSAAHLRYTPPSSPSTPCFVGSSRLRIATVATAQGLLSPLHQPSRQDFRQPLPAVGSITAPHLHACRKARLASPFAHSMKKPASSAPAELPPIEYGTTLLDGIPVRYDTHVVLDRAFAGHPILVTSGADCFRRMNETTPTF